MKKLFFFLVIFCSPGVLALPAQADILYVDSGSPEAGSDWNGVNGSSYKGSPGDGLGYSTLQAAVAAMGQGDVLYLRGGTYTENYGVYTAMQFPFNIDGTGWGEGQYQKIASYPGEWAILDASASGKTACAGYYGLGSTNGGDYRTPKYWIVERLEITGGKRAGLAIDRGPYIVRYCYIHDNLESTSGENPGGLRTYHPMNCIIEYNYFKNNGAPSGWNAGNIVLFSDYHNHDNRSDFNINDCNHSNEIRYNLIDTAIVGIKDKGWQPLASGSGATLITDLSNKEKGNKAHHNIFRDVDYALVTDQDFSQVYNNISDGGMIQDTLIRAGYTGDTMATFYTTTYNNTVLNSFINSAIAYKENYPNIDLGWQALNNVVSGFGTSYNSPSIGLATRQCSNPEYCSGISSQTEATYTWANTEINRNFIHDPKHSSYHVGLPHSVYTSEETRWITTDAFNDFQGATNYTNSSAGLFKGTSGADKYKTNTSVSLGGGKTVANGGGGSHPYLSHSLPAYVGATGPADSGSAWRPGDSPDDAGWVNYVLEVVGDPGSGSELPGDDVPPNMVQNLRVQP